MTDQQHLLNIGMILGAFKPLVARELLQAKSLAEFADILYYHLGVSIYPGEPIHIIQEKLERYFTEELRGIRLNEIRDVQRS